MSQIVYVSKSRIERQRGPIRYAHIVGEANPVVFSVHGAVAEHYGVNPEDFGESHATTIDYLVASVAGWLVGTFGGALEARQIKADGKLVGEVRGEVEKAEDGVLLIRRIHVEHRLTAPEEQRQTAERLHGIYADRCPLYRSVKDAIEVSSSLAFLAE